MTANKQSNVISISDYLKPYNNSENDVSNLLKQMEQLQNKYEQLFSEVAHMERKLARVKKSPLKNALQNKVIKIKQLLSQVGDKLDSMKNHVVGTARQAIDHRKDKGLAQINKILQGLQQPLNDLSANLDKLDRAVSIARLDLGKMERKSVLGDIKSKQDNVTKQVAKPVEKRKEAAI